MLSRRYVFSCVYAYVTYFTIIVDNIIIAFAATSDMRATLSSRRAFDCQLIAAIIFITALRFSDMPPPLFRQRRYAFRHCYAMPYAITLRRAR